jgi:hypothetical protein
MFVVLLYVTSYGLYGSLIPSPHLLVLATTVVNDYYVQGHF